MSDWTDKEVKYLRENYRLLSASSIGGFLGRSRGAVTAKADRLGLTQPRAASSPNIYRVGSDAIVSYRHGAKDPVYAYNHEIFAARAGTVDLADLGQHECRWPLGSQFCGRACGRGPYCKEHHRYAYEDGA